MDRVQAQATGQEGHHGPDQGAIVRRWRLAWASTPLVVQVWLPREDKRMIIEARVNHLLDQTIILALVCLQARLINRFAWPVIRPPEVFLGLLQFLYELPLLAGELTVSLMPLPDGRLKARLTPVGEQATLEILGFA
jgi:hypothetical protein